MLDILGGRTAPTEGLLLANGIPYDNDTKKMVGFVPQDDCLFPTLTVRETLFFSAELRLPSTMSHQEKERQIDLVRGCCERVVKLHI